MKSRTTFIAGEKVVEIVAWDAFMKILTGHLFGDLVAIKRLQASRAIAVERFETQRMGAKMSLPVSIKQARAEVVEQLAKDIQEKGFSWQQEWIDYLSPRNAITGKNYRGGNLLHLACAARRRGYKDSRWCTFNQAKENGWKVKRGAKSAKIEHWKMIKTLDDEALADDEGNARPICVGTWSVFNAEDIEGIPEAEDGSERVFADADLFQIADDFIAASRCPVIEGESAGASYSPTFDHINMPARVGFTSAQSFIRTLLHEMCHSTGHASALSRPLVGSFGSEGYAFEELIAELGSGFAAAEVGLAFGSESVDAFYYENHAAYLQSWIHALKNDPNELFKAATKADAAANYIMERYAEALA